jgi:hypothetical protein
VAAGVFSSEPFLGALNASWYGGAARSGDVAVGGHVVRTLIDGAGPVLDATFLDFFVPVAAGRPEVRGRYAPRVATAVCLASERHVLDPVVAEHAPFVRWSQFASWDDVLAHWKQGEKGVVRESRRRTARLERDLGRLRFVVDDQREEAFRTCLAWKSAQFREAGLPDPFRDPREEQLLRALLLDGVGVLCSLYAADRLVATHLGLDWGGAMHWWLPTYDRSVAWASPGRLLLEWVMRQSYERGDERFDFLRGGADYKWTYATDYRVITEAGRRPLTRRARLARARAVRRYPRLAAAARRARDSTRPIWRRPAVAGPTAWIL